jgi:hypothetical protein
MILIQQLLLTALSPRAATYSRMVLINLNGVQEKIIVLTAYLQVQVILGGCIQRFFQTRYVTLKRVRITTDTVEKQ